MSTQVPSVGRIVHYRLSDQDCDNIRATRARADLTGNSVSVDQVYPALIVRTWGDNLEASVQLQVFLDGPDTYWATSRTCGDQPGQWFWPPYVAPKS